MSYMNCGKLLAETGEYSFPYYSLGENGKRNLEISEPNTIWPPLTSFLLATILWLGLSTKVAICAIIVAFSGTAIFSSWLLSYRITKSICASNIIAILIMTNWAFRLWVQLSFMAEAIFITVTVVNALLLSNLFEKKELQRSIQYLLAGLCVSIAYYIKSAAPAFLLCSCATPFFLKMNSKERVKMIFWLGLGIALGIAYWLFRNLSFHTIGSAGSGPLPNAIVTSTFELLRIFVPFHGSYVASSVTIAFAMTFALLFFYLITLLFIKKECQQHCFVHFMKYYSSNPAFVFSLLYCVLFIAVILFAMYILPIASHIEMRYWLEIVPFAFPLGWVFFRHLISKLSGFHILHAKTIASLLIAVVLIANLREDVRNHNREWNILTGEQVALRKEIANIMKPVGFPVRFQSNQPVRFETLTGLTSWTIVDNDINTRTYLGKYCFVEFPELTPKAMNMDKDVRKAPYHWKVIGMTGEMAFYVNDIETP